MVCCAYPWGSGTPTLKGGGVPVGNFEKIVGNVISSLLFSRFDFNNRSVTLFIRTTWNSSLQLQGRSWPFLACKPVPYLVIVVRPGMLGEVKWAY